ncbi:unnamed protein product [Prorocentrum cordatum]|uniref:VWFA domain-containing protein n=1 Tax=Prorocentrum cordatum TaxID=2364126 RepID=A0ABN9RPD3_9DINO|nr:unnamed protein product [Polarella glacialis]
MEPDRPGRARTRSGDSLGKQKPSNSNAQTEEEAREERIDKLQSILDKHHVTIVSKDSLAILEDYKFVVICDDSESMRMSAKPKEERRLGEKPLTRWHELQEGVSLLVDLLTCFQPEGLDLYFLNAGTVRSVKSSGNEKLQNIFQAGPIGKTPLTKRLKEAAVDHSAKSELPTIMFIFTDGEPDGGPKKFVKTLTELVSNSGSFKKTSQYRVQIMACSNNDEEIAWLSEIDQQSDYIDVTDDYYNEKRRVMEIKGDDYAFTRSDWLVKAILGPVDQSVDDVNEGKMKRALQGMLGTRSTHAATAKNSVKEQPDAGGGICSACVMQ